MVLVAICNCVSVSVCECAYTHSVCVCVSTLIALVRRYKLQAVTVMEMPEKILDEQQATKNSKRKSTPKEWKGRRFEIQEF